MRSGVFEHTPAEFRKIPREQLGFLLASSHAHNEIVSLLSFVIFEQNIKEPNQVEGALITIRRMTVLRIILAKLFEFNNCALGYGLALRRQRAHDDHFSENYQVVANGFSKYQWLSKLRNKTTFHFDRSTMLSGFDEIEENLSLTMVAATFRGLTGFLFAEETASRPIFRLIGNGDIGKGLEEATRVANELTALVMTFQPKYVLAVFAENRLSALTTQMRIRDSVFGDLDRDFIPLAPRIDPKTPPRP